MHSTLPKLLEFKRFSISHETEFNNNNFKMAGGGGVECSSAFVGSTIPVLSPSITYN